MKVTAIVPVLYGEEQLGETLEGLAAVEGVDLEILLVVDVPDPAREDDARRRNDPLAEAAGARPLYRVGERGFGSALRRGFAEATGDAVVPIMADACDDPADIPRMAAALDRGLDVVAGSRYVRGGRIVGNTAKQRISRLYSIACRLLGGPAIHDVSNAFKLYRREVVEAVPTAAESFDLSVELTVRAHIAGYRIGEIPTTWRNRRLGRSSFGMAREVRNYRRWLWLAATGRGRARAAARTRRPATRAPGS